MSYQKWFKAHGSKHKQIVEKLLLQGLDKKAIIDYFDFENMVLNEASFCPLYAEHKKCHEMESLNCYLCACPNFRFNDAGFEKRGDKTLFSSCDINSKEGRSGEYGEAIHQDCSKCSVPHHKRYVEKNFDEDWFVIMSACNQKVS
jgi:hypothetical protein